MSGVHAIEIVKQRFKTKGDTYKLILMDYSMPVMTGVEAGILIKSFMNENIVRKEQAYICCITAYKGKGYEQ